MDNRKRPSDRTFFVYDHSVVQREEDDPKDAIVFFYPHSVSVDTQCLFCGQLMGMVNFLKILCRSEPRIYKLKRLKVTTKHEGNFTLALAHDCRVPDSLAVERLDSLYKLFCMYHGSLGRVLKQCGGDREKFTTQMASIWNCYLPFIRQYGNNIMAIFQAVPTINLPKTSSFIFLKCSHLLQWLKRNPLLLAGCLLYKNKVMCTQLTSDLTARLLLIKPYQVHFPGDKIKTDRELPFGVRILSIFLREEEYKLFSKRDTPTQSRSSTLGHGATSGTSSADSTTQEADASSSVQGSTESADAAEQRRVSQTNTVSSSLPLIKEEQTRAKEIVASDSDVVSHPVECGKAISLDKTDSDAESSVQNLQLTNERVDLCNIDEKVGENVRVVPSTQESKLIPSPSSGNLNASSGLEHHSAASTVDTDKEIATASSQDKICTKDDIHDRSTIDLSGGTNHDNIVSAGCTESVVDVPETGGGDICYTRLNNKECVTSTSNNSVGSDIGTDSSKHGTMCTHQDTNGNNCNVHVGSNCGTSGSAHGTIGDALLPVKDRDSDSNSGEASRGTEDGSYGATGETGNILIATAVSVLSNSDAESMVPKVCINEGTNHYDDEPFEIHINPLDSESSPEHSDSSSTVKVNESSSKSDGGWTENNDIISVMSTRRKTSPKISDGETSYSHNCSLAEQNQNGLVYSSLRSNASKQDGRFEIRDRSRNLSVGELGDARRTLQEINAELKQPSRTTKSKAMLKSRSLDSSLHSNPVSMNHTYPSDSDPDLSKIDQLNGHPLEIGEVDGDVAVGEYLRPMGASTPLLRNELDDDSQNYDNDIDVSGQGDTRNISASDGKLSSIPSVIISGEEDRSCKRSQSDTLTDTSHDASRTSQQRIGTGLTGTGPGLVSETEQRNADMENGGDSRNINQVDGMVNVALYVQAHSDTVLLFMAENELIQDKTTLSNMWQAFMIQLAELELELQQSLDSPLDKQDAEQTYNFLQYSPFERSLKGNIMNTMTTQDRDFVHIVDNMHDLFERDESIDQLIVRGQQSAVLGKQTAAYQTFFQPLKTSAPSSSSSSSSSASSISSSSSSSSSPFSFPASARPGRLEAQAEKTLFKDHGIRLL